MSLNEVYARYGSAKIYKFLDRFVLVPPTPRYGLAFDPDKDDPIKKLMENFGMSKAEAGLVFDAYMAEGS